MQADEDPPVSPLIELLGVDRVFEDEDGARTDALADVSLAIDAGEFVCVTGPSGSGKSTLLNILGCLDRPTGGAYRFAGRDVAVLDPDQLARMRRDEFGFVFQAFNLLESATARRNVELPASYAGQPTELARRGARKLLESFGLGGRLDHRPAELSGGEQQRVSMARALMNGGRVILADEPTGALDSAQSEEVMSLLKGLATQGHTVVIVSHEAAVAAGADRRIELRDGRLAGDSGSRVQEPSTNTPRGTTSTSSKGPSRLAGAWAAIRDAATCLLAKPLPTVVVVLSIALGVASVVTLLSLAEGIERKTLEIFAPDEMTVGSFGALKAARVQLTPADAEAIQSEITNVRGIFAETRGQLAVQRGTVSEQTEVRAETRPRPTAVDGKEWPLARGTFITAEDSERREQVVVLGPTVVEALFEEDDDPIGEQVQIAGVPFLVKGVLEQSTLPPALDLPEEMLNPMLAFYGDVAYVPFYTARDLLTPATVEPEVHKRDGFIVTSIPFGALSIEVRVADPTAVESTAAAIRDLLIRRHGREGFRVDTDAEGVEIFDRMWRLHPGIQAGIGSVALWAAIAGVMGSSLVSVGARRREIGIRMALGARRRDIASQFLVEAAIAAVAGGALGLLLGYWAGIAVAAVASPTTGLIPVPVAFASWFVPVALCGGVATALVAGIVPARRAARLDPVAALAAE